MLLEQMSQSFSKGFQGASHLGLDGFDGQIHNLRDLGIGESVESVHRENDPTLLRELPYGLPDGCADFLLAYRFLGGQNVGR